jgi:hypothetical protein
MTTSWGKFDSCSEQRMSAASLNETRNRPELESQTTFSTASPTGRCCAATFKIGKTWLNAWIEDSHTGGLPRRVGRLSAGLRKIVSTW